jgi:hypothetical protein
MSHYDKPPFQLPTFIYFMAAALCLGGTGYGCDHLSQGTAGGMGCGLVLLAIALVVRGIISWDSE